MMMMIMTAALTITCILRWVPSVGQSAIINAKRPNCSCCYCSTTNNFQSKRTTNISTNWTSNKSITIGDSPTTFTAKEPQKICLQQLHQKYQKAISPKVPPKTTTRPSPIVIESFCFKDFIKSTSNNFDTKGANKIVQVDYLPKISFRR